MSFWKAENLKLDRAPVAAATRSDPYIKWTVIQTLNHVDLLRQNNYEHKSMKPPNPSIVGYQTTTGWGGGGGGGGGSFGFGAG